MSEHDDWGYPTTDVLAERFHSPLPMSTEASENVRAAHEEAYAAYLERYRAASRESRENQRRD